MIETCATCAHGAGEGTIRFCRVRNGAAYDHTARCDWWTEPGTAVCGLITATIDHDGLVVEMQPNESHLLEDTHAELNLYTGPLEVVVDVGAHVGAFALQAAKRGAKVFAIEPSPINVQLLRRNIKRNGFEDRIEVIEKAVASESGLTVPLRMGSPFPGQKSLAFKESKKAECDVETISLTDLLDEIGEAVDFLKIDIEGEEFRIIDDGPVRLLDVVTFISISLHDPTMNEYFDFGDGRTRDEYYADMVKWLEDSGVLNARIHNHMAIGGPSE